MRLLCKRDISVLKPVVIVEILVNNSEERRTKHHSVILASGSRQDISTVNICKNSTALLMQQPSWC